MLFTSSTSPLALLSATAPIINKNPTPRIIIPTPIFTGVVSLRPIGEAQNKVNNGAKVTINSGFTDWNQEVGISKEPILLSIYLSVYNDNEEPACSNPAQKNTAKINKIKITEIRCFSSFSSNSFPVSGFIDF